MSHNSPVYPGLQPVSHLPVVLLHVMSPEQCPLQLNIQYDPNVPVKHSEITMFDEAFLCILAISTVEIGLSSVIQFLSYTVYNNAIV